MSDTAEYILNNSDLLIKADCVIIDDVLYEHCRVDHKLYVEECYRYFISVDDYDYVEDTELIKKLDSHFKK